MKEIKQSVHSAQEHKVLKYWDENKIFDKSVRERPEGDLFVFYDGPPFATGLPHYGHLVGSVIKDVVPRFWTMRGKRVERVWGWDCHGLPIENIVQGKNDLKTSDDIENFGICKFSDECRADVMTYADEWQKVIHRLGRWIDMDNPYRTMDLNYMESVWWVFKELWDKDRIYEGRKPMHVCPRCETVLSNFEVGQGYQDVKDISITAQFKIKDGKLKDSYLLAWTTTPWTLPGNVLLAVKSDIDYIVVKLDGNKFILAKELEAEVLEDKEYEVEAEVKGLELIGLNYEPLFPVYKDHKNAFRVVSADFVTTEEGTGIVHIAPGFGEDDMVLGQKENVEPIIHVKLNGKFEDDLVDYLEGEGFEVRDVPVKAKGVYDKIDIEILKYLFGKGLMFKKKKFEHSYPHCWRCETPLLNYSTSSWFVKVADMRDELLRTNDEIHWVPDNMKQGRFGRWLEGARDWAISRSRYWGAPLPIWRSEDDDFIVVGSREELESLSGEKISDLHKHIVDDVVIRKNGKEYHRIPEVLDCWFESGAMPYAQLHYPFENKSKFDRGFPSEFIAEGQDQTRGWFYTLHVLSNSLFKMPAFKNVIVNGIVLAEDGKKMSKRLKNYPDPMKVMEEYGSDAVRYYLMSSPVVRADNIRFNEREVGEVSKKFINILKNVLSFYELYEEHDDKNLGISSKGLVGHEKKVKALKDLHVLDKWILSRLQETLSMETGAMESYELQQASRVLQGFVTDLSTWYIRRSRDRMKVEGNDRTEALAVLRYVLITFSKMIAPFMPFLGEMIYQGVGYKFNGSKDDLSVHLAFWPEQFSVDEDVIDEMGSVRALVSRVLEIREEAGIPVKQVLGSMTASLPDGKLSNEYIAVLSEEVNVKEVKIKKGDKDIDLDLNLTPELIREGISRDIIRRVNQLRKKSGKTIKDRINLFIYSDSDEIEKVIKEHGEKIEEGALALSIKFEKNELKNQDEFKTAEHDIWIGF